MLAHLGTTIGGLGEGLAHPLLGPDHVAAIVAVGLLAGREGSPRGLGLPAAFAVALVTGASIGLAGVGTGAAETALVASVVALTALVLRPGALGPVALFAVVGAGLLHGHAHAVEIGARTPSLSYVGGIVATSLLALAAAAAVVRRRPRLAGPLALGVTATALAVSLT